RMDIVDSTSNLVCSVRPAHVLRKLVGRRVGDAGIMHGGAAWPGAECTRHNQDDDLSPIRRVVKILYSHVIPGEERSLWKLFVERPEQRSTECTHHIGANRIGVTQDERVVAPGKIRLAH